MTIDVDALSPGARAEYIAIGRGYGSEDTLAQADEVTDGLAKHAAALVAHGFGPADAQKLADARQGLLDAGVERKSAGVGASQDRVKASLALRAGKDARESARSVLLGTRDELLAATTPAASAALQLLDATVAKTSSSGGDFTALRDQLGVLAAALGDGAIAAAAAARGGPSALAAVTNAKAGLAATPKVQKRGTPAETERLDLFDGIIVKLARAARRAARAAAKEHASPAIAKAFALTHLDGHHKAAAAPGTPTPATPAPAAPVPAS